MELTQTLSRTATTNGRRVAELEKQLQDVAEKLAAKKDEAPAAAEIEVPVPPDPEQYVDDGGVVSNNYLTARAKYDKDMAAYLKAISEDRKKLRTELEEVKSTAKKADSYITESIRSTTTSAATKAQQEFEAGTDELQKMLGLETSKPWRTINQQVKLLRDEAAPKEARDAAQLFIKGLSKQDSYRFDRLAKAAGTAYDLSTLKLRYDLKSHQLKGALIDAGFAVKDTVPAPAVDLENLKQQHEARGVTGIPPEKVGSDEPPLSGIITPAEKEARLKELQHKRGADPVGFRQNPSLWQEFSRLSVELGYIVSKA
jgi:hypothetical protein